jgi:hypothetical protein
LSAGEAKQQRLHDERVDRRRTDQPSPEAKSRTCMIPRGSHDHELMLMESDGDAPKVGYELPVPDCFGTSWTAFRNESHYNWNNRADNPDILLVLTPNAKNV